MFVSRTSRTLTLLTWKNLKKVIQKKTKIKISGPMRNKKINLPDGSDCITNIQDHVEYIMKNHDRFYNPPIRIHVNKTENKIYLELRRGYYLRVLTTEPMKLLWSTKSKIAKDETGENMLHLEITDVVLAYFNIF